MARGLTAVVVPNYRTAVDALAAVRSVATGHHAPDDIFVVDNASPDDSAIELARHLSAESLILADRNRGFAAGCNIGIRAALDRGARRVLLLNPDATLAPGALDALERALDDNPALGIVGPVVRFAATPDRIESAGIRYVAATGRMRHLAHGRLADTIASNRVTRVDAVSGCAMLVRREVFDAVGLLDEPYFYGFEDLEFCLRARAAGFATAVVPGAVVSHRGQASMGAGSPQRLYFAVRNHLRLARRVGPQAWPVRTARAAAILGWTMAFAVVRSGVPVVSGLRAIARGVRDHRAGRYGPDVA